MIKKTLVLLTVSMLAVSCSSTKERKQASDYFQHPAPMQNARENITINFAFDSADLSKKAGKVLSQNVVKALQADQKLNAVIEGHCDERGSEKYNHKLGMKRATSVKQFLEANGVAAARIKVVSYGKTMPLDTAHNEKAWAKNRRAVTVYLGN